MLTVRACLSVLFIGILTVRACLHDADEGLLAGLLYAACSAANGTSLEQLQQAILLGGVGRGYDGDIIAFCSKERTTLFANKLPNQNDY